MILLITRYKVHASSAYIWRGGCEHNGSLAESWTSDRPVPGSWLTGCTVFLYYNSLLSTGSTQNNVQTWLINYLQESNTSTQTNKIKKEIPKSMYAQLVCTFWTYKLLFSSSEPYAQGELLLLLDISHQLHIMYCPYTTIIYRAFPAKLQDGFRPYLAGLTRTN